MKLPEAVVEAAHICQPTAEVRARGVINALAANMPDEAVDEACLSLWQDHDFMSIAARAQNQRRVCAAIAAFLKCCGEAP